MRCEIGIFIQIDIDNSRLTQEVAKRIVALCPINAFTIVGEQLVVQPEQEDECTLCELCLDSAQFGALTIRKIYKDEQLVSRGEEYDVTNMIDENTAHPSKL